MDRRAELALARCRRQQTVNLGVGLAPLSRKLFDRIQAGDYVDFGDFPIMTAGEPLVGAASPLGGLEEAIRESGTLVERLLGFGDRRRPKKEVPTISLWMSCFILFRRALLMAEPHRGAELDAYAECILDAARANRWEFVRIYDRKFRQAAVGDQTRSWAVLDPSLFTKEVTGPQATFLASTRAPAGPDKKDGAATSGAAGRKRARPTGEQADWGTKPGEADDVCRRFNWQDGRCSFGSRCKYRHICARCRGQHPSQRCPTSHQEWPGAAGRPRGPPSPQNRPRGH